MDWSDPGRFQLNDSLILNEFRKRWLDQVFWNYYSIARNSGTIRHAPASYWRVQGKNQRL
jgi:hypothetical protein